MATTVARTNLAIYAILGHQLLHCVISHDDEKGRYHAICTVHVAYVIACCAIFNNNVASPCSLDAGEAILHTNH